MSSEKPLLSVLSGKTAAFPPIWLMRQAGRYLSEYREIREKAASFLDFCYDPVLAAEATLQPIRRFGFDAAILFSDILVIPDALGQQVSFETGEGPRLDPIETPGDFSRLKAFELEKLAPVLETIERVKGELPPQTAFIGFCGAPWTVASYMIAGRGTKEQEPARLFAYLYPDDFARLIAILASASVEYLCAQIDAGVEVVQIFDSWAGSLPPQQFERWVFEPLRAMVAAIREKRPQARVIVFARGAGTHLPRLTRELGADGYGVDTAMDGVWAARKCEQGPALQGNLDPLALVAGGATLEREIDSVLGAFAGRAHIFNLGHGILPQTQIAHEERLIARVRRAGG